MQEGKVCPQCSFSNIGSARYCGNCQFLFDWVRICSRCGTRVHGASFCFRCGQAFSPQFTFPASSDPYYRQFPGPFVAIAEIPSSPSWWRMPVYFLLFCIFGLTITSTFISLPFLFLLEGLGFRDGSLELVFSMVVSTVNLFLIFFALKKFRPFQNFFKFTKSSSIEMSRERSTSSNLGKLFLVLLMFSGLNLILLLIDYLILIGNFPINSGYDVYQSEESMYIFLITIVVFAPVNEEILFRQFFHLGLLRANVQEWIQYVLQGLVFTWAHLLPDVLAQSAPAFIVSHSLFVFVFAICATWLRKRTMSIVPPILFHAIMNGSGYLIDIISSFFLGGLSLRELILVWIMVFFILGIFLNIGAVLFSLWKPGLPASLASARFDRSSSFFVIGALVFTIVSAVAQYLFLLVPDSTNNFLLVFLTSIGVLMISSILYIYWGNKVIDSPWIDAYEGRKVNRRN